MGPDIYEQVQREQQVVPPSVEVFVEGNRTERRRSVARRACNVIEATLTEREELAYSLLASLPRSRLATVQRRIAPLLQFDIIGSLPSELALRIFLYLPWQTVLVCALVSRRWRILADDQALWRALCLERGWEWKQPRRMPTFDRLLASPLSGTEEDTDDEGMGSSDEEDHLVSAPIVHDDSGYTSTMISMAPEVAGDSSALPYPLSRIKVSTAQPTRHSAPSVLPSLTVFLRADYKLLYQTHIHLHRRILSASYRLSSLQKRGGPTNAHTNTIYCLQLYTHPEAGMQVLFTGSRDRTIREWDLSTGTVTRVIAGVHEGSVLSICVHGGYVASAGSDNRVAVWHLGENRLIKLIVDHEDSVLCVRFDDQRLVSCSKDRTIRTFTFPNLTPQFVLCAHTAAVNAVAISQDLIVSGSGDRSIKLWDANTGKLLRTLDNHHGRGIASIDFKPPYVVSGSSDKHVRLFDLTALKGWSTCPEHDHPLPVAPFAFPLLNQAGPGPSPVCQTCGSALNANDAGRNGAPRVHSGLVRSVVLGEDVVLSGSYDLSIKVWDRKTGKLLADLTGGHTGRIFCVGFDGTKLVSCGEDQRICVWDFAHGIDTSFVRL